MPKLLSRLVLPLVVVAAVAYGAISLTRDDAASSPPTVVQATGKLVAPGTPKAKIARKPPVVMIVMDEFPVDVLRGPDGKINADRYPNFAALANTGTWYRNASTSYDSTTKAVPEILDGRLPKPSLAPNYVSHPHSIFTVFHNAGYRVVRSEVATSVCPPRICPGAKKTRPAILPLLQNGRREDLEGFFRKVGPSRQPTLFLKHVLMPHGPYLFLPSGKQTRRGFRDPLPGTSSTPGFYDRYLTEHNEQRLRLQLGFADRELGLLFDRMDRLGILDKSMIVVTADHGISSQVGVADRRQVTRSNIDEIGPVPLFVKAPGQRLGRTSNSYVKTIDILPTIASMLRLKLGYRTDGHPASSRTVRRRRSVTMIRRDFKGKIRVGAREMERRRAKIMRRSWRLYGSGGFASLYTNTGPNRALIGKAVADLHPAARASVSGSLIESDYLRHVNPASVVLPTEIAGHLRGGGHGKRRDIAVSVNGRIVAVARTVYLRNDKRESFAVMIPETSLRNGSNDVRVYQVSGGRRLGLIAKS